MRILNGVSTIYLNSYTPWFKWIELFVSDKDAIKTKSFIVQSCIPLPKLKFQILRSEYLRLLVKLVRLR